MRRLAILILAALPLAAQKFYPDDPLLAEPAPRDAGKPAERKLSDYYDLFSHIFTRPGERQPATGPKIASRAVNTLGDPMDGAWYARRHYWRRLSTKELQNGPGGRTPPELPWTVIKAKGEGITPGFTVLDARQRRYFIKLDPVSNPEMMTAAEVISSRFFHALGYHVPDQYIVEFSPDQLVIQDKLTFVNQRGFARPFSRRDLTELLLKAPRKSNGKYRAVASVGLEGRPIGPFRWYGRRADDPNDIVPHEHRRELRAAHVFCAWLGHEDSRAINTLDTAVASGGRTFVRHHLMDFGSTLGSASDEANSPRSGAYHFSWRESAAEFFSLGLAVPYWAKARYPRYPSIGRFESKVFDPERWFPEYPNPAFLNRLPDDEFWAAKQVMAFTDEEIRAIVRMGQLSDSAAAEYLAACLIERRDKIGRAFFKKILPIDHFRVTSGELAFDDLSARHNFGSSGPFAIRWRQFDNAAGQAGASAGEGARLPSTRGFWVAEIAGSRGPQQSVRVFLRDSAIIGIERQW